ncbi:ABC a-pheromone efflux pump AtrD [Paecilomyces variotii No. 5]|uniref:ABC a-pheromone efflux pump AtrD n=1 Tax=Byssochlamys spectabilis (strain No. 5 / NBRC 109023) TaxID=1356009 RepID=V5GC40_BYSSN|nr:ABC a-pheromone efflux pump AtrD [Paecilomyces variotii No. 5]
MEDEDVAASYGNNRRNQRVNSLSLFKFTTRRHIPTLTVAVVTTIAAAMIQPLSAIFLGNIFDTLTEFGAGNLFGEELLGRTSRNCGILLSLGAANWILTGLYFMFWLIFGELQAKGARDTLFEELLKKDVAWFECQPDGVGALLVHIQAQIRDLQRATSEPFGFALQFSIRTLVALGVATFTSWRLTLVTLAAVPPCAVLVPWLSSRVQDEIDMQQRELATSSKITYNAFSLIRIVKCFNGQEFERRKYLTSLNRATRHYLWQAHLNACQISCVRFMSFGMFVQGFWYGSFLITSGSLSSGQVLRTFWACLVLVQSIEQILPQTIQIEKGKISGTSLETMMAQASSGKQAVETVYPRHCKGRVEIKDLSFTYPSHPERLTIQTASLVFPAGEVAFIVGHSGSGKSTLASLLARFYAPTCGETMIDGYPIEALHPNWIRDNITLVHQQSTLFYETIFRNIAFGCLEHESVTEKHIQESIDMAMLRTTIESLPDKLDTVITSQGNTLSGGQKQRVAIARSRLRDTPILILDECTSALDYTTRRHVMSSIYHWRKGKTTIVITHDLSQVRDSDLVYVLDHGRVIFSGHKDKLHIITSTKMQKDRTTATMDDLALFSTLVHAIATPVFAYLLSRLLQTFYANSRRSELAMKWSLAILVVGMWIDSIRKVALSRILNQSLSWFEQTENGPSTLVTNLTQDAEDMRNLISKFLGFPLLVVVVISIASAWSVYVCWELTLVIFACAPFIHAITNGFDKISKEWENRCDTIKECSSSIFADTFSRIQTVKALALEPYFRTKHMKTSTKAAKTGIRRAVYSGLLFGLVDSMVILISALIFYYGAVLASSQVYTTHDVLTVFSVLLFSTGYITMVLSWIPQMNSSQLSADRLLRMANLGENNSHEHTGKQYISDPAPISFVNTNFAYPSRSGILALRDFNLSIPANSCTTISNSLVPCISMGGLDIGQFDIQRLRSLMAVVPQQPALFPDTITANIAYGLDSPSPFHTPDNIRSAAKAVGIDDFILSLPEGYSTIVGDGGLNLSGGQTQLLTIARALVRKPRILVLDEVTSSLDAVSAGVVRQTVRKLVAERRELTVIIISHSREMMEIADKVVVMEQGAIVEEGSYSVLMQRKEGSLRRLVDDAKGN